MLLSNTPVRLPPSNSKPMSQMSYSIVPLEVSTSQECRNCPRGQISHNKLKPMASNCRCMSSINRVRRSRSVPTLQLSKLTPKQETSRSFITLRLTIVAPFSTRSSSRANSTGELRRALASLYEEVRYDADGNPLTANFADYGLPADRKCRHLMCIQPKHRHR